MRMRSTPGLMAIALLAIAGCSGGSQATTPGVPTTPATQTPTTGASSSASASGLANVPITTVTTHDGYVYKIQPAPPFTSPTLTVGLSTQNAPPGKDFIVLSVTVSNGLSDRPEPLSLIADTSNNHSYLEVALPTSDLARVGLSTSNCESALVGSFPQGWCALQTSLASFNPEPEGLTNPQLQVAQPETATIAMGYQVPATLPLSDVGLFAVLPSERPVRIKLG